MSIGMGEVLKYINAIPDVVAYVIVDDFARSVYISHTTKFRGKLGEISDLMRGGTRLEYFCISTHPIYKLVMAEKVRAQYINKGYKVTNQVTPFIKFTPGIRIEAQGVHVLVYITSSRGLREIVGVFKNMKAAQSFYDEFYGDSWDGSPVYAINEETARYWRNAVYKRMYGDRGKAVLIESSETTQIED